MNSQELINEIAKRVNDKLAACGDAEKAVEIEGQVLTALKAQRAVDQHATSVILSQKMQITDDAKAILSRNEVKIVRI